MTTRLDHLVIGAASLEQGVDFVRDVFGVDIPRGGEHPLMATHNHVMQLGHETFIEVIAINPDAKRPTRPRWFGLDDPAIRHSLKQQPRLLTWVVNTTDLAQLHSQVDTDLGVITPLSRGNLNWLFAVPDDGRLLAGGMVPNVMQWQTDAHPSNNMADLNCRLRALHLYHPYPQWLSSILTDLQASELVEVHQLGNDEPGHISAELETPRGVVVLSSAISANS